MSKMPRFKRPYAHLRSKDMKTVKVVKWGEFPQLNPRTPSDYEGERWFDGREVGTLSDVRVEDGWVVADFTKEVNKDKNPLSENLQESSEFMDVKESPAIDNLRRHVEAQQIRKAMEQLGSPIPLPIGLHASFPQEIMLRLIDVAEKIVTGFDGEDQTGKDLVKTATFFLGRMMDEATPKGNVKAHVMTDEEFRKATGIQE
jgi:hypothetical protein